MTARSRAVASLVLLLAVAGAVRAVYVSQLRGSPSLEQHRWSNSDMSFFDEWAEVVAAGDWLTDRALHPHHDWHERSARIYLERYPEERAALEREAASAADGATATELLWRRWYGGKRFHQEPLYPYLVAGARLLFGPGVAPVFALQLLLGMASVLLVYALGRGIGGPGAGLAAAALAVLYAPLLLYELVLLRSTWISFASLGLAWLILHAQPGGRPGRQALLGAASGCAILLKSSLALVPAAVLAVAGWRALVRRGSWQDPVALLGGLLLVLSPVIARNAAVGAPLLGLSSVGAVSVISANAADTVRKPAGGTGSVHLPEIMRETGGALLPVVRQTLATHDDATSYLTGLARRFATVWQPRERPNNTNLHYYALHAPVLGWLPVGFVTIAALALPGLGIAAARRERRSRVWPLALLVGTHLVTLVAFGTYSRYRVPLAVVLLPFAGFALSQALAWLRERRALPLSGLVAASTLLALLLHSSGSPSAPRVRPADWKAPFAFHYRPRIQSARDAGDAPAVAAVFAEALSRVPDFVEEPESRRPRSASEADLARFYARIFAEYARALQRAGRPAEASRAEARARLLQQRARAWTQSQASSASPGDGGKDRGGRQAGPRPAASRAAATTGAPSSRARFAPSASTSST